jgi:predicted amidohydrolase
MAEAGDEEGVILADIDVARVSDTRKKLPSLLHDRDFSFDPGI